MKSQAAAFAEAHSSLHRLGVPDILPALRAAGLGISRTVLGGSHSVAVYPPIDSLMPVDPSPVIAAMERVKETSLYVHIAFCETRCTFCHYPVLHYPGKRSGSHTGNGGVTPYLDALKRELRFWSGKFAKSGTTVSSVYIGGGTPLVLEGKELREIMDIIGGEYHIAPNAEICMEGSPLTITAPDGEEKLRFLKDSGITRLSFGVQSFDDTVLKYAARGYKRDTAIRAARIVDGIFDNWNIDLIQGLYKGSPLETWENLKVIAEILPAHLTWYHGRFADRPQGDWYNAEERHSSFEDEAETLLGRMLIWRETAALGYQAIDGNRFVRDSRHIDPFKKIRTSSSSNLLGIGAASYSHIASDDRNENSNGYIFRNEVNIRSYTEKVMTGSPPIAMGRVIDDEELLAASYAAGLRHGRVEDTKLQAIRHSKPELSAYYERLARRLCEIGILRSHTADDGGMELRLTELGKLFEDETLTLFFSPKVKETLAAGTERRRVPMSGVG
jgi:coproporphyrinogen III oxidase-like Fe-S oxidoreductase